LCPAASDVLPNLVALDITQSGRFPNTIFFRSTLTTLCVKCEEPKLVPSCMSEIRKMTRLEVLELEGYCSIPEHALDVIGSLQSFRGLTSFSFDAYTSVIPAMLRALSTLPRLEKIAFEDNVQDDWSNGDDVPPSDPTSPDLSHFDSLKTLTAKIPGDTYGTVTDYLSANSFGRLRKLDLSFQIPYGEYDEQRRNRESCSTIATCCPALEDLRLYFNPEVDYELPLDYSTIEPLVIRLRLKAFVLDHVLPVALSQADIVKIAQAWGPTLRTLDLNHEPGLPLSLPPQLSPAVLIPIAQYCPQLRSLSIYIDTTRALNPEEEDALSGPQAVTFSQHLVSLNFGYSYIQDPWSFVPYLRRLTLPLRGHVVIHGDASEWTTSDESKPPPWQVVQTAVLMGDDTVNRKHEELAASMDMTVEKLVEAMCLLDALQNQERLTGFGL
jgi:hypothetical protein